ncbi:MAG: alpha/beta hydrolase [Bacilli bacterium]|nr:alpha/beta hydrolase [Bacilli bacterium]
MLFLYIGLGLLGLTLLMFIVVSMIFGRMFFHISFDRRKGDKDFAKTENPNDKKRPSRIWFSEQKLEELSIISKDKLCLKGYLLNQNSNKLAIILHGYRGRYYSSTAQAQFFFENGYDVLLPNNRAHDTSEGDYFTMGKKEVYDVLKWINLMVERNPNYQIVLMGISMGGHITMMTAGRKELSKNVKCFVEDCGYHSLKEILFDNVKNSPRVKFPKYAFICGEIYTGLFHHFSLNDSVKNSFKNVKIPGLFIHGDKDTYVPYENLDKNYDAMPEGIYKEKKAFAGVEHNRSVFVEPEYKDTIINFVNRFIK